MRYVEPEVARKMPGLRLVLSAGFPGPWGQAIKTIFDYKGISFVPVAQYVGRENAALREWVGVRSAPVIVDDDSPPITTWSEAIVFAERRSPSRPLLPPDSESRALMFGLINEIAGYRGFGWCYRSLLFQNTLAADPSARNQAVMKEMTVDYELNEEATAAAPGRMVDILGMLTRRLAAQRALCVDYLVGSSLTAADIYWACFSIGLQLLPDELCPMSADMRRRYTIDHPAVHAAKFPLLIEHRDRIFKGFLGRLEF